MAVTGDTRILGGITIMIMFYTICTANRLYTKKESFNTYAQQKLYWQAILQHEGSK